MSNTLQQITDAVYKHMQFRSDSTVFDRTTVVVPRINRLQDDLVLGSINNVLDPARAFLSPVLSFAQTYAFYRTVNDAVLTQSASSGDTTVYMDTSDLPSAGALHSAGCTFTYSGKTADTVTGVSGLVRDLDAGEPAKLVFETPIDFGKPFDCEDTGTKSAIEFIDDRNPKFGTYYTVKQNYDASKKFLYFSNSPTVICLSFVRKPEEMADDTDETILPEQYGTQLLALLVAGGLLY